MTAMSRSLLKSGFLILTNRFGSHNATYNLCLFVLYIEGNDRSHTLVPRCFSDIMSADAALPTNITDVQDTKIPTLLMNKNDTRKEKFNPRKRREV